MSNIFFCPTQIYVEAGCIKKLGELSSSYGKNVFLVIDPFFKGTPTELEILGLLKDKEIVCYYKISPNPRDVDIDEGAILCVAHHADMIVAIGGGSAIDSAKAINVVARNGGSCWEYTKRAGQITREIKEPLLPFIAITTTAGTGSEATRYSVITHALDHSKGTLKSDAIFPNISIVDSNLMLSMPRKTTALTGIDAFAHAFESFISSQANAFSDLFAKHAMQLFIDNIRLVCLHGDDSKARNNMALCSTLGGLSIAHSATTLPHAIGQALSGVCDAPHGGSIAVCMPEVIRWTLPSCEGRFAEIACMFQTSLSNVSIHDQANALPDLITKLFHEIIGEDLSMKCYGLTAEAIERVADLALSNYKGDVTRHPKVATKEDLVCIITKCL